MWRYLVPLVVFVGLSVFLWKGLELNPRDVPSPLVNKAAPQFDLPQLSDPAVQIKRDDMLGQVWILNVWASWCVSCRQEHPVLMRLARQNIVPIYGLNYKDEREAGINWLNDFGNPYVASAFDANGRVGVDYGVYGVPESYLIDKQGVIRLKYTGPITDEALMTTILPKVKELQGL
jgi:cytochrome c biogenesis protein CcmG/thiol:disulfide interchange protein DsbE